MKVYDYAGNTTEYTINCAVKLSNVTEGDITGDTMINALDMLRLKLYFNGKITLSAWQLMSSDTSDDARINSLDLLKLKLYLNGKIQSLE